MASRSYYQTLPLNSRQVEAELGARLPKQIPNKPASMTPTMAVIQVETMLPDTPSNTRRESALVRDIPEWILTSRPMSRAHVHLISCLLLPVKNALRPLKSKIRNDAFFTPWPAASTPGKGSHRHQFTRVEALSYAEQLAAWYQAADSTGSAAEKIKAIVRATVLDPGPTLIQAAYVRILLQMALDAMGSYYIEHDLELLNLEPITRQKSELEATMAEKTRGANANVKVNPFVRMLRRHSAS